MNPIFRAEWLVLSQRVGARALLAIAALIPALVVVIFLSLSGDGNASLQFNGKPLSEIVTLSGPNAASLSLRARNFFLMPLLFLVLAGQSMASERSQHVLREQLLKPVSRQRVLWSKVVVVWAVSVASLLLNAAVGLGLGSVLLGAEGEWSPVLLGHLVSVFTDFAVIVFGFFLACHLRSSVGVIAVGLMLLAVDSIVRVGLKGLGLLGVDSLNWFLAAMPGTGLNMYQIDTGDFSTGAMVCLIAWSAAFAALAQRRIIKMDVP